MATGSDVIAPFPTESHDHVHCIEEALDAAEQKCSEEGLRLTPLRRRVLELVWSSHEPVGAYHILDTLREERAGAAPPTVYRALEFLRDHDLIHRIESLNAFVGCGDPARRHGGQFLICTECGAVAELDDPDIAGAVACRADALGFTVDRQTIEVSGRCGACAGKGS
jgi:Fur family zinc uptake transcriptional regulator